MAERKYRSIDEITHNGKPLREILKAHRVWIESEGTEGSKADLKGANLNLADLFRADLGGADLSWADLTAANLSGIGLSEASLSHAKLIVADLSEAYLSGANLFAANLVAVNLVATNLSGANLSLANLIRVNLTAANLSQCWFGDTTLANCDLSEAIGLDTVRHGGPSSIGVDTILKSKGKIPESFLRGAGVPDIFIQYMASLTGKALDFYSCFISHSSKDQQFCDRLYADLQANHVRCWYFPEDATMGKNVWGEIDRSIRIYDKLVVVCSEASLKSGPVIREIERALQCEDREKKDVLFPIRIDDYLFDKWEHPRKADVIAKVVGDFRNWTKHEQYKKNFDELLKALNRTAGDPA